MDDEQLKAMMTIMAWQQMQLTTMRNLLCKHRIIPGKAHLQEFRSTAIHLNDFIEMVEETIVMLQDPTRIDEAIARLQGFEDDFREGKGGTSQPAS